MYSKEIEEVIDAALLVGVMTDNVRNALRCKAEAEGEDADEVIMVAEMRLKKVYARHTLRFRIWCYS